MNHIGTVRNKKGVCYEKNDLHFNRTFIGSLYFLLPFEQIGIHAARLGKSAGRGFHHATEENKGRFLATHAGHFLLC